MTSISKVNHEDEFNRAWDDNGNARFELNPVDINQVLGDYYHMSKPLAFTRAMLWDMEVRKAWRPDLYISSVVKEGSANSWGKHLAADGTESFFRSSQQRLWLNPAE